jgi:aspartate aminotransferase-like enzyme
MNIEWGKSVNPEDVRIFLHKNSQIKIVLCQACETSTATSHDIQTIGKIISETSALFLVDGITAAGAYDIQMDAWHIDGLVAGSQKAVMLPTGMSFVSFSEKAWKVVETAKCPRFYFDLRKELKANKNGETLFSSPVPLIRALDFVLTRIQEIGLQKHFLQLKRRADFTRAVAKEIGLGLFSSSPSDSVTALNLPTSINGVKFREQFEKKYFVTVMGGQDQLKGQIIRLGHMGYILDEHLVETMYRLSQALRDDGYEVNPEKIKSSSLAWLKANPI